MSTQPNSITLTESQVDAITYIEQVYFVQGLLPVDKVLADAIGVTETTVAKWWKNESFQTVLNNKGIPISEKVTGKKRDFLLPEQMAVANMVLNTQDRRSLREKLESTGVSTQKYTAWRRDPTFIDYMKKRAESMYANGDDQAYVALMKNVEAGDLSATKLFFEMRGIYNPKVQIDLNPDMVLARVVEIIQKHVKDPAILEAIAWDIDALGGNVRPPEQELPREIIEVQALPEKSGFTL